jgi:hypothetical protein
VSSLRASRTSVSQCHISLASRRVCPRKLDEASPTLPPLFPISFLAALLRIAQPQKGSVFYDLGSGVGKAVFGAALLYR